MTDETAGTVANVLIGAAAVGVAYYIVKTPPLRRAAWKLVVAAMTGTIPAWLTTEVHHAWTESAGLNRAI
jgi:hypothetical protein